MYLSDVVRVLDTLSLCLSVCFCLYVSVSVCCVCACAHVCVCVCACDVHARVCVAPCCVITCTHAPVRVFIHILTYVDFGFSGCVGFSFPGMVSRVRIL